MKTKRKRLYIKLSDTEKRNADIGDKIIVTSIKYDKMISKKYKENFVECDIGDIFTDI